MACEDTGGQELHKNVVPASPLSVAHDINTKSLAASRVVTATCRESMKRKVNELIADLHGMVQRWKSVSRSSFQTLTSLDTACTQLQASKDQWQSLNMPKAPEYWKNHNISIMKVCECLMKDLSEQMMQMNKLLVRMEYLVRNLEAIDLLDTANSENIACSNKTNDHCTLWTARDFYKAARSILNCYTKEWLHKQELSRAFIRQGYFGVRQPLVLSVWLQEPHLSEEAEFKLENMLLECGLR